MIDGRIERKWEEQCDSCLSETGQRLTIAFHCHKIHCNVFLLRFSALSLQTEAPGLSLGCCVDLIPQVKVILASKYEE